MNSVQIPNIPDYRGLDYRDTTVLSLRVLQVNIGEFRQSTQDKLNP